MKFSIGDRIVLNRTGEEGFVTAFINNDLVEVEVGGVVFPVHAADIDHPYLRWFTEKNTQKRKQGNWEQLPVEKLEERKDRLAKGVYLSFMPVFRVDGMEEVADEVKIYLLNETPHALKYSYDVTLLNNSIFSHEGALHAFGNVYLHNIPYRDMNDQPRFQWRLEHSTNDKLAPAGGIVKIKPSKLFQHIDHVMTTGEPTFAYLLVDELKQEQKAAEMPPAPAPKPVAPTVTIKTIEPPKYELDLHIEALVDNKRGMSNADIIQLQLSTLERYLQLAVVHRQESMVVIHGLGKGKLREEVHALLKKTRAVARFKNEWSARYGFGATEVRFRY